METVGTVAALGTRGFFPVAAAAAMQLTKTEGTVEMTDNSCRNLTKSDNIHRENRGQPNRQGSGGARR